MVPEQLSSKASEQLKSRSEQLGEDSERCVPEEDAETAAELIEELHRSERERSKRARVTACVSAKSSNHASI